MQKPKSRITIHISLVLIVLGFISAVLTPQHFVPLPSFYQEIAAAVGFLLAFLVVFSTGLVGKQIEIPWGGLSALLLIAVLLIGVRAHPEASLDYMLWPLGALLVAGMASWYGHALAKYGYAEQLVQIMLLAFAFAAVGTSFILWVQITHPGEQALWLFPREALQAPSGNLGQRNQSALLLSFGLIAFAYWGRHGAGQILIRRVLAISFMLLLLTGIALTQSRIAFGFMFVAGLCMGVLWAPPKYRLKASALGIFAVALVYWATQTTIYVGLGLGQLFPPGTERLADRGLGQRLSMLSVAWQEFRAHPFLGGGFGSFSSWEFKLGLKQPHPLFSTNAHNIFAQVGAEFGLVGLLALLLPGCISLWKMLKKMGSSGYLAWNPWSVAALSICVMLLGYSLTEFPLWYVYYLIPFALFWGVLDVTAVRLTVTHSMRFLIASLPLAMLIFMGWASVRYMDIVKLTALAANSPLYQKFHNIYQRKLQDIIISPGFSPIVEALNFYSLSVDSFMLHDKLALGERAAGNYTGAWFMQKLAYLYALDKKPRESALTMAKACAFYPDSCPDIRENLIQLQAMSPEIYGPVEKIFSSLPQYNINPVNVNILKPWEHGDAGTVVTIDPKRTWFGFDLAIYASGVGAIGKNGGTFVTTQSPVQSIGNAPSSK